MSYESIPYLLPDSCELLFEWFNESTASYVPDSIKVAFNRGFKGGFELSAFTIVVTVFLEIICWRTVQGVLQQKGGVSLYASAVFTNFLNHFVYGIPTYMAASILFMRDDQAIESGIESCLKVIAMVFFDSVWFYAGHRAFHTNPELYKYHRFHHRFNSHVPPMAANAVSFVEYMVCYVLPFATVAAFLKPHDLELRAAVFIVSMANILEHTPPLSEISKKLPIIFSTVHGHLEHHRKLTAPYAAPTFNIDYLVEVLETIGKKKVV